MENYLHLKELCCGYPGSFHLQDISFSLARGSFTGIIGPNGSGKTTLFRGLTGEIPVKSGRVMLNDQSLGAMPAPEKARNVAIVSQFPEAADISVEDYVLMGRMPFRKPFQFFESKRDIAIARRYMKLTHVYHLRHKSLLQISGGEQQLAAIAQALTQEPSLLLMDEPTSHLDITHQVQILNLIQKLNEQLGLTVLMIIHDLNLAAEYCDYLIMMHQGRIFKMGTPLEVLNYKNIEEVYNTVVVTRINPISQRPAIFLVSDRMLNKQQ